MTLTIRKLCFTVGFAGAIASCSHDDAGHFEQSAGVATSALERAWTTLEQRRTADHGIHAYSRPTEHKKHRNHAIHRCKSSPELLTPDVVKRFAAAMDPLRRLTRVPGASVALVECGQIKYEAGFGMRDLEGQLPVTQNTVFRVGSTTKAMTSALIATWVDEGRLDFSTRAVDIDPSFRLPSEELTNSITVGQLMGMGTGLDEPPPYWWEYSTVADLFQILPSLGIVGAPGMYLYNNAVYASAGYVGLAAAGVTPPSLDAYAHAMEQRIFHPIGMYPAALSDQPANVSHDHAHSYGVSLVNGVNYEHRLPLFPIGALAPAGSAVTSASALARFVVMQLNGGVAPNGARIVSEKNLMRTHAPQTLMGEGASGRVEYAMGWVVQNEAGVQTVWHNGGIDAFGTLMWTVPEDELGLVVLANGYYSGEFYSAAQETLMQLVYGSSNATPDEIVAATQAADAELVAVADVLSLQPPVDPSSRVPYLGQYEHQIQLSLDPDTDELIIAAPGVRGVLSSIEGVTGRALTFVIANGGSLLLLPIALSQGPHGPQIEFLDANTFEAVGIVMKLQ